ncbi:MAG: PH domain-containing protein [Candidatus Avilachnospira sp.]|jgi:uncharacterized membrane protein YdbT with pleckstrin-like domain
MDRTKLKWYARKRLWCRLPWTFTKYGLSEDRIFVETGLLNLKQKEVRLYRVLNISLSRSLVQRIFGMGTVHIDSNDKDLECFELKNILDSENVKEMISAAVEEERLRNRVSTREFMSGDVGEEGFEDATDGDMEH